MVFYVVVKCWKTYNAEGGLITYPHIRNVVFPLPYWSVLEDTVSLDPILVGC